MDNKEIKELEKSFRKAKNAIPFYAAFTVTAVGFIFWGKLNFWQSFIFLLLSAGYLAANVARMFYSKKKLTAIARSQKP